MSSHHHHHNGDHHEHDHAHQHDDHSDVTIGDVSKAGALTSLRITGMDCADEVAVLERVLKPIAGVHGVRANIIASKITVAHEPAVTAQQLIDAITPTGMGASLAGSESRDEATTDAQRNRLISVGASGVLTGVGLVMQWTNTAPPALRIAIFAAAIVAGGWFIFPKALAALRRVMLDMNVLMSVAVIGAAVIGEWSEGAAVTFLFGLSEYLEAFSVQRARRAIQSLMQLSPETALLKEGENVREVAVEQVSVGAMIAVKSGARIPLDGKVAAGASSVNQAPITGESMPVEKKAGDEVFAGTINGEGALEVEVTKRSSDSMLARIIHLVEEAQGQKAPSQRFVDVFAKYYTPAVMLMALGVFLIPPLLFGGEWFRWTYRALVLLVIACPCALVISTPVSIVSGLTAMARRGVLIKGGAFLEAIGKLRALALDKTGTITEGRPRVREIFRFSDAADEEIIRIAAGIDTHSDHPLALAVVDYATENRIIFSRSVNYRSHTGKGAEAIIGGHRYFVGNHRFTHEMAICSDEIEAKLDDIQSHAQSVVVVGHMPHADCKGEVLGILAIGDAIRDNARQAIRDLHAAGVRKVVMLSGDNQRTVDAIAREVGIDEAQGDLLPDQKIERVKQLLVRHKYAGMIGDGVNDAPAMAVATVAIAMGAAGTDTAIETADIALMKDDLSKIAETIQLGRRTLRIIQFNIAFALVVKAIFLVLALLGYASLWLAIAADTGATLVVVANALRLLSRGRDSQTQQVRKAPERVLLAEQ